MGVIILRSCEVAGWCETSDGWAICAACNDLVVALCPSGRSHGVLGLHSGLVELGRCGQSSSGETYSILVSSSQLSVTLPIANYSPYQPIILPIIGEITFPLINLNNKCQ